MRNGRVVKQEPRRIRAFGMHRSHRGFRDLTHYRRNHVRYATAFVLITAVCFAAALVASLDRQWLLYLAGWAVALSAVAAAWFRPSLWLAAPFGALAGAVLVRAGTDGLDSGLGPLLLIPILAVAIYGSRQALALTFCAVIGAVLAIHLGVAEGAISMTPVWRQDVMLAVLATVLGLVIQDLATRVREERNLAEERGRIIEQIALTDPLTGVDNRRGWERAIRRSLGQARRQSQPLCVAMLDLDHFKPYNDSYGHQAGDEFLQQVALGWEERTRIEDHIARYGGDEFIVTLPGTGLEMASGIIERLRVSMPEPEADPETPITCSAGIAEWNGSETVRELVARADRALYLAKDGGRNRTVAVGTGRTEEGTLA